jgi:hypothetical protein
VKYRATAIVAALAVVTAGALAAPAVAETDTSGGATASALAAPVRTVGFPGGGLDAPDSLPDRAPARDLTGVEPASSARGTIGNGALSTVVDAVLDGEALPDGLARQAVIEGDGIRVEVTFDDLDAARTAITAAGGSDVAVVTDSLLAATVPADAIAGLDADPAVVSVALPAVSVAPAETSPVPATVGGSGDDIYTKTAISQWNRLGLTGKGISVGIVDYFDQSAWNASRASGDVPAAAGTFCRWGGQKCSVYEGEEVHGVAVAEAIHDMAPGAKLYLATAASNEDLKKAIDYFASKGVRILSRSLGGFYDGPGDGTGPSAKLVNYAVKKGITWFNSAGNSGAYPITDSQSPSGVSLVGGYWRQTWRDTNGNGWMEFAHREIDANGALTGEVFYSETMSIACSPYFRLRWSDWGTSKPTDYDIYRVSDDNRNGKIEAGEIYTPGYKPNKQSKAGVPPLELQNGSDDYFGCSSGWIEVGIKLVSKGSGTSKDVLELAGNSGDIYMTASSAGSAGEAFNDSKNKGMATVGAVDPVEGMTIAGYSSQGPTNDGRIKPELSAGSNFTSRAYASQDGRFNGTSAATPIVAGAAAVALQRFDTMKPSALISYLRKTHTVDRGAAGTDNVYGTGELIMSPLAIADFTATPKPTIAGTRAVGYKLTAKTNWTPSVKSAKYQWFRGETPISGATKSTYTLTKADAGKKIKVSVTGSRPAVNAATKVSSFTGAIAEVFAKKPAPKISGTAKVGRTLTAKAGTWSPKPSKITYQWKANGKAITGATKKTYKITSKVAGKRITVTVKVTKKGYLTASKTSSKTGKVTR